MSNEFVYVEKPFMELLDKLGWNTILSEDDNNKFLPKLTLRKDFDEVLIESRLKESKAPAAAKVSQALVFTTF